MVLKLIDTDVKNAGNEKFTNQYFINTKKKYDEILMAHAKFEYCVTNFLYEISLNNDIAIAGILAAFYAKALSVQQERMSENFKHKDFYRTKYYKYIYEANLEECERDIKSFKKLSNVQIMEQLFNLIMFTQYEVENATDDIMVRVDGPSQILTLYRIEENNDFVEFKKQKEREVYDWLVEQMHTDEDGLIF